MELFGVLLIGAGVVMLLGLLGVLRSPGGGSLDVGRLARQVMDSNRGYPVREFHVRQADGSEVSMSYPLNNMDAEPYGGMVGEALAEELNRRPGGGPGPNHPG